MGDWDRLPFSHPDLEGEIAIGQKASPVIACPWGVSGPHADITTWLYQGRDSFTKLSQNRRRIILNHAAARSDATGDITSIGLAFDASCYCLLAVRCHPGEFFDQAALLKLEYTVAK